MEVTNYLLTGMILSHKDPIMTSILGFPQVHQLQIGTVGRGVGKNYGPLGGDVGTGPFGRNKRLVGRGTPSRKLTAGSYKSGQIIRYYKDLSRGHLKRWFSKGIPPKSP